jgi:hypothetical protein
MVVFNRGPSSRKYIPVDPRTDNPTDRNLPCNVWGPSFSAMTITWGSEAVEKAGLWNYHRGLAGLAFPKV